VNAVYYLGVYRDRARQEALGYCRAALAIRPCAAAYNSLGLTLLGLGDLDGALAAVRQALTLSPEEAVYRANLAVVLNARGDPHGARAAFRQALHLSPQYAPAHTGLGVLLEAQGDLDGAIAECRQAITLDLSYTWARKLLAGLLVCRGRPEEARAVWQVALERGLNHDACFGYAEMCLYLGWEKEYLRQRRFLLERFGETADPVIAERTARACLLLPASGDDLTRAAALADRAAASDPKHEWYGYFLGAKGLAEYRRGRWDSALDWLRKAESRGVWMPTRLVIAMALHRQGKTQQAREALAEAVRSFDWDPEKARDHDPWIAHVLRREAEALIVPNLSAVLKGEFQPKDNLAFVEPCRIARAYAVAARLYEGAFAADPERAADFNRYNAACMAALAGSGQDISRPPLNDVERARWRKQALAWLRAVLAGETKRLGAGVPELRRHVAQGLRHWQRDSDLAGLRDPEALAKLPPPERDDCRKLWAEVEALVKQASAPGPQGAVGRAYTLAGRAEWQKAAAESAQALQLHPQDPELWMVHAGLLVLAGDTAAYRAFCRRMQETLAQQPDGTRDRRATYLVARSCLLAPNGVDPAEGVRLAEQALAAAPRYAWHLHTLALAHYRAGQFEQAVRRLEESMEANPGWAGRVDDWLLLALAHHRLGHAAEVTRWLEKAVYALPTGDFFQGPIHSHDRLACELLRREAEALMLPNRAAFLRGDYQPTDNKERLALIGLCRARGLWRRAARLYAEAFAADPKLAEDLETGRRYDAACLAALAGCGQGKDNPPVDATAQARWRRQALAWLRADLEVASTRLEAGKPEDRQLAQDRLRRWQNDPCLAGLNDAKELEKVPAAEREEWQKLWAEVDALLAGNQQ
jgi:tetratricopeptide (TPR) repeat protein